MSHRWIGKRALLIFRLALVAFTVTGAEMPAHPERRVDWPEGLRAVVKKVPPEYNPMARQMRVQGEVEVEAHVTDQGEVENVRIVSGNALLTFNVVKAVKKWRFQPFQLEGRNVPACVQLRFQFKI